MQIWVKEHQSDCGEELATLAKNHLLARKGLVHKPSVVRPNSVTIITDKQRPETIKYKSHNKKLTCFACGKTGHFTKDCEYRW